MRKALFVATLVVVSSLVPASAFAWGFTGHRLIMRRAIDLLPAELKPFFTEHRDEIVARSIDPDLWRNVGWEDDPNHFLDFGARELGEFPFVALPREYGAALEKFGMATLKRNGLLPWRATEIFGNLRRGFEGFTRGSGFAANDVVLFAPVLCHYVQDAHQPLHATINYNGQLTGNEGIHSRFESDLIERFDSRLRIVPPAPTPVRNPRDFAFDTLLASYQLVDQILKADTAAAAGKEVYDDDYFEKLFASVRPILEKRLSESIAASAGVIIGAWEAAGKPALKLDGPRTPQKVRKP
jgi:hypothetical protein